MLITTIKYERVRNLGNYESERITLEAAVNENEDPTEAFETLKQNAIWLLYPERRTKETTTAADDLPF